MAAVRVSLHWFGVRKSLTADQKAQAADTFGAASPFLSAAKKLLDTRHPQFKAVTAVRTQAIDYWHSQTLPFPEKGIRLLRHDQVESFHEHLTALREKLQEAVSELDLVYGQLRSAAQEQLGSLYNPADYPQTLVGLFDLTWDFPSIGSTDYLRQLNPALFEQEQARVASRFDEAVRLAEQAFLDEFAGLVTHLTERLTPGAEGQPKVFRDSALSNVLEFFARFRSLSVCSNDQLETLVQQAQNLVQGVSPQALRDQADVRNGSPASWPGCKPRSTACWSIDRDGGSSAHRKKEHHEPDHSAQRPDSVPLRRTD